MRPSRNRSDGNREENEQDDGSWADFEAQLPPLEVDDQEAHLRGGQRNPDGMRASVVDEILSSPALDNEEFKSDALILLASTHFDSDDDMVFESDRDNSDRNYRDDSGRDEYSSSLHGDDDADTYEKEEQEEDPRSSDSAAVQSSEISNDAAVHESENTSRTSDPGMKRIRRFNKPLVITCVAIGCVLALTVLIVASVMILKDSKGSPTISETGSMNAVGSGPAVLPTMMTSPPPSFLPSPMPSDLPGPNVPSDPNRSPVVSVAPTAAPKAPPFAVTSSPTSQPTPGPSHVPTTPPSNTPSLRPSLPPSLTASQLPSFIPSQRPSSHPTSSPSYPPTSHPTGFPTSAESQMPSRSPPSSYPTSIPTELQKSPPVDITSEPSHVPSNSFVGLDATNPAIYLDTSFPTNIEPSGSYIPSSEPSDFPSGPPSRSLSGDVLSELPSIQPSYQDNNADESDVPNGEGGDDIDIPALELAPEGVDDSNMISFPPLSVDHPDRPNIDILPEQIFDESVPFVLPFGLEKEKAILTETAAVCGTSQQEAESHCAQRQICRFIKHGDRITSQLQPNQEGCVRRCDFPLGENHCFPNEQCFRFVLGCKCALLSTTNGECRPF